MNDVHRDSLVLARGLRSFAINDSVPDDLFIPDIFPELQFLMCSCAAHGDVVELCEIIRAFGNNLEVEAFMDTDEKGHSIRAAMNAPLVRGAAIARLNVHMYRRDFVSGHAIHPYPWEGHYVEHLRALLDFTHFPPLSSFQGIKDVQLRMTDVHEGPTKTLELDEAMLSGVESFCLTHVNLMFISIRCTGNWHLRDGIGRRVSLVWQKKGTASRGSRWRPFGSELPSADRRHKFSIY